MKHASLLCTAVVLSLLPATALAQAATDDEQPPQLAAPPVTTLAPLAVASSLPDRDAPRFRFGVAGSLTGALAGHNTQGVNAGSLAPGLTLDFGLQINDRLGVLLRGEVSSLLFVNQAAAYVLAEWTPVDWFSVATGFGYDAFAITMFDADGSFGGFSVPLSLGFNILRRQDHQAHRSAFRIGVEGAVGVSSSSVVGGHGSLTFGYALM